MPSPFKTGLKRLAVLLLAGALGSAAQPIDGRFDVGGYQLYLRCTGTANGPTLVLLGGFEGAMTWSKVEAELARATRVCVYDSAGVPGGRSDLPRPNNPSDGIARTSELSRLLDVADVRGPFVFVALGPSAHITRLYIQRHPEDVRGVVFVHGHTTTVFKHMDAFFKANTSIPIMNNDPAGYGRRTLELFRAQVQRRAAGRNEPNTVWDIVRTLEQVGTTGTLGARPLAVIIPRLDPATAQGATGELRAFGQRVWAAYAEDQRSLAALSTNSVVVDAPNAWYHPELDDAQLVIHTVLRVVEAVRANRTLR